MSPLLFAVPARGRHRRAGRRTALVGLLCAAFVLVLLPLGIVLPPAAEATVRQPFAPVFSTEDNGAITIVGNSQMTCPSAKTGCPAAKAGTGSDAINNSWDMDFIDADSSSTTTNSTTADLTMPAGSTVLYARLVWGGRLTAGDQGVAAGANYNKVSFRPAGASAYATVTASAVIQPTTVTGSPYQASLDVTGQVAAAGSGTYAVGNMVAGTGGDRYAGWSLVVAYRNPSLPLRNLVVFEGFADVTDGSNASVSVSVSGFLTPAAGPVNATVGFLSWEGDLPLTGDTMKLNGSTLSDAQRPANNTFDSTITNFGSAVTTRNPNAPNTFGVDMGRMSANGVLPNSSTSTTVNVSTSGDVIYLGLLTTEIDLYSPSFVGISKTVTNLSGNTPAQVGDTLQYTLSYTNSGADYADASVLRDVLPAGISYVPGTIRVTSGANASSTPKTDSAADDVGEYVAASRLVRVRVGTGANASTGGTLAANASTSVTFRATVDRSASGGSVVNGAFLDYRARTLARSYTFVTNTVSTAVASLADLAITKTSSPTTQAAGGAVTYTLGVTNNGPNAATGVVATDTLPTGVTFVGASPPSGVTCSRSGQVVTCTVGTLANAASVSIPILTSLGAGAAAGSVLDVAQVTADTADDDASDNTATAATTVSRSADLRTSAAGSATATAGGQASYTFATTNDGPSTATAVTFADNLVPGGMSVVSATPSSGTCTNTVDTVSCTIGDLAPGATRTVTVVGRIASGYTDPTIPNGGSFFSTTTDPNLANNGDSATTAVSRRADLSLTKAVVPANPAAGTEVVYTLRATNAGPSDATEVVLTDPVPTGMTFTQVGPSQGTCDLDARPLTCALGTLTPGGTATVSLTGAIAADRDPGGLTNTATVATTTPETVTGNNSASATSTVVTRADLSLSKIGTPNPVVLGEDLTYTLTATNLGPSQARGVVVDDTLPGNVSFLSGSAGCQSGPTVHCVLGAIDVGDTATATITVGTPEFLPEGQSLTNSATVSGTGTDPTAANDTATFTSGGESFADVSLTKSTDPNPVVPGQDVTYRLTASNAGPSQARDVTITDALPPGTTYRSSVPEGLCAESAGTVTCTVPTLGAELSTSVEITASVAPGLADRRSTNTAVVTSGSPADPTTSNNTATSGVDLEPTADLSVALTTTTPQVVAGRSGTFAMRVRNTGPSTARGVVVTAVAATDLLPDAGTTGGACTVRDHTLSCVLTDPLDPGDSVDLDFDAALPAAVFPDSSEVVTATVSSTTADGNSDNDSSSTEVTTRAEADISAAKSVDPDPMVAGAPVTYTLTATNRGPSDAANVTLTDTLSESLTGITASPSSGTCTVAGQRVDCSSDRLAPDGVLTVLVTADLADTATGGLANTATAGSDTDEPEADQGDDTATIDTGVTTNADLRLTKTADPEPVSAGQTLDYTLTVYNAGPSVAATVYLTDNLPAGLTFTGVQAPPGTSCGVDGNTGTCSLGDLAVGASQTITVSTLVAATLSDQTSLTNTASVYSPTPGSSEDDRTASATSTVTTSADLAISKTANTESPLSGGDEEYVLTAVNNGPSVARGVVVTDDLPDGERFVSAVNGSRTCTATGGRVSCDVGDLAPGRVAVVQISVHIDPDAAPGLVSNVAQVSSDTAEVDPEDNRAQLDQRVSAENDLQVTKTRTSGPVVAGQPVTYQLSVANLGPSQAHDVAVTDLVQDPLGYTSAEASKDGDCRYDTATQTLNDDDQVVCSWPVLDVGDTRTATVTFTTPATLAADSTIRNTATATSDAPDPTPATATVTDTVTTEADLHVTKSLLSGVPVAGGEVRWQILVTNPGPSTAQNVRVTDVAPTGVAFTSALTGAGTCEVSASRADCSVGAVGTDPVAVTVVATLAADYTGSSLTNAATVTSDTTDLDTDDNVATVTTSATTTADLGVVITAAPSPATAGQDVTWTAVVTNGGPSRADQLSITDSLPSGVTLVSAALPGGVCGTGSPVVCSLPSLSPGASTTLTLVGRLARGYALATVAGTVAVSASTADPNPLNNSATVTTPVVRAADVAVAIDGPAGVVAGSTVTWGLTATNGGPSDATTTALTFTVPSWVEDISGSFTGGSCTVTGGQVSCPLGTLAAAGSVLVTVTGRVPAEQPTGDLATDASISSAVTDPQPADNTAALTSAVTRSADVTLAKVATTSGFTPGDRVRWTLTATNAGPSTAEAVVISDAVPAGVHDVTATLGGVDCAVEEGQVSCPVSVLAPGIPAIVTVSGVLDALTTDATVANTATLASTTPDPDTDDNTSTVTTDVDPTADLSIGKQLTTGTPVAGAPIGFVLEVTAGGPSVARNVVATDTMPDLVTITGVTTPIGSCAVTGQDIRCALGDLPAGSVVDITVTGTVGQAFSASLANTAEVTSDTPDPDSTDDQTLVTGSVDEEVDLGVSIDGPSQVSGGQDVEWVLTITNAGPSDAREVALGNQLPDGVTLVSAEADNGATCTVVVSCDLGSVPAGGQVVVRLRGRLSSAATQPTLVDNAAVSSSSAESDTVDNTASLTTAVEAQADLVTGLSLDPTAVTAGTDAAYTLDVGNDGPSTAIGVTTSFVLPAGLVLRETPTADGADCQVTGRTVSCFAALLDPGQHITVQLPVSLDAAFTDAQLTATATTTSATPDPVGANNIDTVVAEVETQADLTLTKTAPAAVTAGEPMAWGLTLTNDGPSDAQAVVVTDELPAGLGTVVATTSQGTCSQVGRLLTCTLGTVPDGAGATLTVRTDGPLDPGYAPGDLTNTATATSPTADDPSDLEVDPSAGRTSTVTTTVAAEADVEVYKVPTDLTAVAGGSVGWTMTVVNRGPSTAAGVRLSDPTPAGLDGYVLTPPSGVTCNSAHVCTVGTIQPGIEAAVAFTATADVPADTTRATVSNEATATDDTDDPDPGNNTARSTLPVTTATGLSVTKVVDTNPVVAGRAVSWTLTAANAGPSDAQAVVLTDAVPDGVGSVSVDAPTGTDCSTAVRCTIDTIRSGSQVEVVVHGVLDADFADALLVNEASVTSDQADPDQTDNTASVSSPVTTSSDLTVAKTGPTGQVLPGDAVSWTLTVGNDGPSTARSVVVADAVPSVVGSVTAAGPENSGVTCTVTGNAVSCALGDLADGADPVAVTVSGVLAGGADQPTLANTATVSSDTADPDLESNSATSTTELDTSADLSATKSVTPDPIEAGQSAAFTIDVANAGPAVARSTQVLDTVADGMSIISATTPVGSCTVTGQLVSCDLGDLAPTGVQPVPVLIAVAVAPDFDPTGFANVASVLSNTSDPDLTNNTASVSGDTRTRADLHLTKTADVSSVAPGGTVTWTLTARNDGPATARSVTVSDQLPAGVTVTSTEASTGGCGPQVGGIVCALGDLAPEHSETVVVTATVAQDAVADLVNSASIQSSTTDPDPADDVAERTVSVTPTADLGLTKVLDTDPLVAGGPVAWTLTAHNDGPAAATGVVLTDDLPAGVGSVTVDAPNGVDCSTAVRCTAAAVASGADVVVTVHGVLAAGFSGASLANSASVTADQADPDEADNTATVTSSPTTAADVSLTKTGPADPVEPGGPVSWTLAAQSSGPSTARDVVVSDVVPAAVGSVAASGPAGVECSVTGQTVSCDLGDLAAGADPVLVSVSGVLSATFAGDSLANTASVSSATTPDPDLASNTATSTSEVDDSADLSVTKSVLPNPIEAGGTAVFTIEVSNAGPAVARVTRVVDTVADGMTVTDASTPGGTCTVAGQVVGCELGDLAPTNGNPVPVVLTVAVAPDFDPAGFSNVASVVSSTTDPDLTNNTASVSGDTRTRADLHLTKTADASSVVPGGTITWTLTARNDGPATARAVTVSDQLPAGVTVDSTTASVGTCAATTPGLVCTLGDLAPDASETVVVTATVAQDAVADLVNSATLQSSTTDPDPADDVATSAVSVVPTADLSLTKSLDTDPVVAGRPVAWTLTVANAGPSTAHDITVTDVLPAGATFDSASPGCSAAGQVVTCVVASIAAQGQAVLHLSGSLASTAGGSLSNTASLTSATDDPDPENDSATSTAPVTGSADVTLAKTGPAEAVAPGGPVAWTLTVGNDGPSTARGVVVSDVVPAAVGSVAASGPAGVECSVTGQTVSCDLGDLAAGADPVLVSVSGVLSATFAGDSLANTASVSSATTPDPDLASNTATSTSEVDDSADLSVTKSVLPNPIEAGGTAVFTIEVSNAGPAVARGAQVVDTLADGMTVTGVTTDAGTCTVTGQQLACALGDLAVTGDEPVAVAVAVAVAPGFDPAGFANVASVTAMTPDLDLSNNTASVSGDTQTQADLHLTKTADVSAVLPGGSVTWTLTASNDGPATARAVTVTDQLPAGVTLTSAVASAGSCDTTAAVVCPVGDLAPGDSATVVVTAAVAADAVADLVNSATLQSSTTDPDLGDNVATSEVTVTRSANLSLTKVVDTDPVVAGQPVTWALTVANAGPSASQDATVTDVLPAGVTFASASPGCAAAGQVVTCVVDPVAANGVVVLTVTGNLSPTATGTLANTASLASADDPDPENDSATSTSPVTGSADVTLAKTGPVGAVAPGGPVAWTLSVGNDGPSTARGVVVSDVVPVAVGSVAASGPAGVECSVSGQVVSCDVGDLASGGEPVLVSVSGVLSATFAGDSLANTASVASETADPDVASNTATSTSEVDDSADLSVTTSVLPNPIGAVAQAARAEGGPTVFTIDVTNAGPAVARETHLVATMADGLSITAVSSITGACTVSGQQLACALGDLAVTQEPVVVLVTVAVGPEFDPTGFANVASVTSMTRDPDLTNNSASVSVDTPTQADLHLTKTADVSAVLPGGSVTWTLTASNDGPATARAVTVTDQLPAGVTLTSAVASAGSCDTTAAVVCPVGDLAPGDSATVVVTAAVAADAVADLVNSATLQSSTTDPDLGDNVATSEVTVTRSANLSLTKVVDTDPVVAGQPVTWALTVANAGPSASQDATVTDVLPAGVTFASASPGCAAAGQVVTCVVDPVAANGVVVLTVTGNLSPTATGTLANTASLASADDPDPENDSSTTTVPITQQADLAVTKTVSATEVAPGEAFTWTVRLRNDGPSDAAGVVVADAWPAGVELLQSSASQGSYDPATHLWTLGTVADGGDATLTLTASSADAVAGLTNGVSVEAGPFTDPDGANDVSSATLDVLSATPAPPTTSPSPSPAPTTTTAPPTQPPTSGPVTTLPNTGGPGAWLPLAGLLLVLAGSGVLVWSRRRRPSPRRGQWS